MIIVKGVVIDKSQEVKEKKNDKGEIEQYNKNSVIIYNPATKKNDVVSVTDEVFESVDVDENIEFEVRVSAYSFNNRTGYSLIAL